MVTAVVIRHGSTIRSIVAERLTLTGLRHKDTAARRAEIRWPTVKQARASNLAGKAAIFRALAMPIAAVWAIEEA